jgi:hypothetical protein
MTFLTTSSSAGWIADSTITATFSELSLGATEIFLVLKIGSAS